MTVDCHPQRVPTGDKERLLTRIQTQPNGCWHWTGFITKSGHGAVGYRGKRHTLAHRAVYTELRGEIPAGLTLDHLCHTNDATCQGGRTCPHRRCVNPEHLEPVTLTENSKRGGPSRRSHCPKNHPYTAENTLHSNRRRYCRTCQKAHADRTAAKRRAAKGGVR